MVSFYDWKGSIRLLFRQLATGAAATPLLAKSVWRWAPVTWLLVWAVLSSHSVQGQTPATDTLRFAADTTNVFQALQGGQSAFADFNNDGYLDLLMTGTDKDRLPQVYLYIHQQDSSRLLQQTTVIGALMQPSLALADYNNDMFIDVLLTGTNAQGQPVTKLYANQGNALFTETTDSLPALRNGSIAWADLNSDGRKDLFLNGLDASGKPASILLQNKDTGFQEVRIPIQGLSHGAAVLLDDNQDGRTDLFITGLDSTRHRTSLLYYSQGKFRFKRDSLVLNNLLLDSSVSDSLFVADSLSISGATAGDYNHDGRADLLIHGQGNDGKPLTRLYLRQKSAFKASPLSLAPIRSGTALLADLDNDGRTDVLLSGVSAADTMIHQLYRNVADDSVHAVDLPFPAVAGVQNALGDFTNDGNLDLLQTGWSATDSIVTRLYRNTTVPINDGAMPPIDADVMTLGDKAIFTWSTGSDDTTQATALTYDLYISQTNGYPQLKASEANTGNYFRWVVAHGSQGQTNTCILEGLPEGDFLWDIIAVDNAFQSGIHRAIGGGTCNGNCGGTPRLKKFRICDKVVRVDTTLCVHSNLVLSTDQPATWYSNNQGILAKNAKDYPYQVTEGDTLFALTMVANQCTEEKRFVIRSSKPAPFSLGNDTTLCPKQPLVLQVGSPWKQVQWYVKGKGLVQTTPSLNYLIDEPTEVWAQVTNEYGCVTSDTIRVNLHPLPAIEQGQVSVLEGESVELGASGGVSYQWSPPTGLSDPSSPNPAASPEVSTTYYVTITTPNGCEATDSIRVTVNKIPPNIFVPSLFTPNGDGKNDDFRIYGAAFRELVFQVYDRSGSLLYETSSPKEALNQGWDGQVNGTPQPNGSYIWILRGTFTDGSEIKYKGKTSGIINLMR